MVIDCFSLGRSFHHIAFLFVFILIDFLKCYNCAGEQCTDNPSTCPSGFGLDRCIITSESAPLHRHIKSIFFTKKLVLGHLFLLPDSPLGTVKACGAQALCDVLQHPTVKCCDKDLCNGAGTIGKNLLLLLVPVASIFVLS